MSILSTENLVKIYGQEPNIVKALNQVSIEVNEGEFVAIIGTSGSGKSTLLNMIGGLDKPNSGETIINNKKLSLMKDEELTIFRRRNIGFIFQNYNKVTSKKFNQTIIMITHNEEIAQLADRIIRIEDGRVVFRNRK